MDAPVSPRTRDDDLWRRAELAAPDPPARPVADAPTAAPARSPAAHDVPLPARFIELTATRAEPVRIREARDVETQRRLDAMMTASRGPYRTPDGQVLPVGIPFRMTRPYKEQRKTVPQHMPELVAAAATAHLAPGALERIECGRGSPEEVRALTQVLIDRQPRGGSWTQARVQQLMFDHGIGIDCAGYVQQAFLRATGFTRSQAHLAGATLEDLSGLTHKGFVRIDDLSEVRPGDLVALEPQRKNEVGHRTIVYEQHVATAADMRALAQSPEPAERAFAVGGLIHVFEVDSSWGSGGRADVGGVKRETWLYNDAKRVWGFRDWHTREFVTSSQPYDHPLDGFYRKGS